MDARFLSQPRTESGCYASAWGGGGSGLAAWGKLDAWDLFVFTCTR